jgi:hypothetical protein
MLLFDNGPHRLGHTFLYSRVLEINPATQQVVWKYQDTPEWSFYSPRISNAQRLPNGNTLISGLVDGAELGPRRSDLIR